MKLKERAKQLKTDIPALVIALKDQETPLAAKILARVTLVYALSPIDLIPDFIPIIGYLDDLIIIPVLIALTIKLIPSEVMSKCREDASSLDTVKKRWFYAVPIVLFWFVILLMILQKNFT